MNIWQFQRKVTDRILAWSGFSVAIGAVLTAKREPFWRGLGSQFIGWGLVDAAIGLLGQRSLDKRMLEAQDLTDAALLSDESRKLRRLLWLNTGLDLLYVLGGLSLARKQGKDNPFWRGGGAGIVLQGGFLFFFDLIHALKLGQPEIRGEA
jgi:hypothetical protein